MTSLETPGGTDYGFGHFMRTPEEKVNTGSLNATITRQRTREEKKLNIEGSVHQT
jgi:hypothetical protein